MFTGPTPAVGNVPTWDANPNLRHFPILNAAIDPGVDNFTGSSLVPNVNGPSVTSFIAATRNGLKAVSAETFLANSMFTTKDYAFDFVVSHRQPFAAHMASGSGIGLGSMWPPFPQRRHQV